ncbi:hypothetical protein SAMN04487866_11122 [Thermoactinomyces sp. DSM 45891]|nr:hypothetical protein SAMN04487866_11122 [Thermoactinomyces sp. DSM 45891]
MMKNHMYLCEQCGHSTAKYEARTYMNGSNQLVCQKCLHELRDQSHKKNAN